MTLGPVVVAATLAARAAALVFLALIWLYFRRAQGRLVEPFRRVFGAFVFLFVWVTASSVIEAAALWPGAGAAVERAAAWIVVPNTLVAFALWRLFAALRALAPEEEPCEHRKKGG